MASGHEDGAAPEREARRGWWARLGRARNATATPPSGDDPRPALPSALESSGVWLIADAASAPLAAREGTLAGAEAVAELESTGPLRAVSLVPIDGPPPETPPAPVAAHASGGAVVRGTLSLILREGFLRVVVLAANVALARILVPQVFGVFVILGFFNTFLTTFGAFGLGPAIVQRREEPKREELAALFTFQVAVAAVLVLLIGLLAPLLASAYHLGDQGVWLIRVMAFSFLLISASSTPMALLERRLAFGRIAMIEVSSGVIYQAVAVALALVGVGVWSLVVGTLASGVVWLGATYLAEHWVPRISLRWRAIWPLVRFGLQYQVNSFISLFKDNIVSTFVAALLGATAVGYINWATTLAFYPLILVQLMGRVTFPAFARALDDRPRLQRMVEATIRYQCYVAFPAVAALAAFIPQITSVIFTDKWQPAVPLVYFFLIPTVTSAVTWPLIAGLNALGRPDLVWRLMLLWLVLDWALGVTFVLRFGYVGFAIANACVTLSSVATVILFKRFQPLRLLRNIVPPSVSMLLTTGIFLLVDHMRTPSGLLPLALDGVAVFVVFIVIEAIIDRHFVADVRYVLGAVFSRLRPRSAPVEAEAVSR